MKIDLYGQPILNETDLCGLFLQDPTRIIKQVLVENNINLDYVFLEASNINNIKEYVDPKLSLEKFDELNQSNWYLPEEYKNFDIAKFVLDQCTTEEQLQRAGDELLKFQDRNMFVLLKYLKYLVDTMRKNGIVWGVGRGSSVASYVLFLIGVHKIDSLYYDLPIDEFLK